MLHMRRVTDDDRRRQLPLLVCPPTLCVAGSVKITECVLTSGMLEQYLNSNEIPKVKVTELERYSTIK